MISDNDVSQKDGSTNSMSDAQVQVYYTADGTGELNYAPLWGGAKVGYETGDGRPEDDIDVEFCDWPFTKPNFGAADHIEAVKREKPELAVAPDIEKQIGFDRAIDIADRLNEHAETVVVVPKSVSPAMVPDRFRVGFPAASFGSGSPWSVWYYRHADEVHLLGGGPEKHRELSNYMNVKSVDTGSPQKGARFGSYWTADGWVHDEDMSMFGAMRRSYKNMMEWWNDGESFGKGCGDEEVPHVEG